MEKSFGLLFFLRKLKSSASTEHAVYMRLTVNGSTCEISTKRKCLSDKWNASLGRLEGKSDAAKELNGYLDALERKVYDAKRKLIEEDKEITSEAIKNVMVGVDTTQNRRMLLDIFAHHNEQMGALIGKDGAKGTLVNFNTTYKHTSIFIQEKYKKSDIDIRKLDFEFISEFEFWLKSVRDCAHNSCLKHLANLRKIVNRCIRNGWLPKDPFIGFNMTRREVERTALTENELRIIAQKEFGCDRLVAVRDIFLFSCLSGLAYADVKKLKASELVKGNDNAYWIIYRRQKTDSTSRVPLLPFAKTILDRYQHDPARKAVGYLLPVLSNQKMNAYLKEIADLCGISKQLTFHIARHTFATTVTLSNGVPIETVSKMLGHKNLKTTQVYAKILDNKISRDMKHLHEKFVNI